MLVVMSMLSYCMHLVCLDGDDRVEDYQEHVETTTWSERPEPPMLDEWRARKWLEDAEFEARQRQREGATMRRPPDAGKCLD
jgi:hypothetical protein